MRLSTASEASDFCYLRKCLADKLGRYSLVDLASGDWQPDWVVVGHETAYGDPFFASSVTPHLVFSAMHKQGLWNAELVAPSLGIFGQCFIAFRPFAAGQGDFVQREVNPPTLEQQAQFLKSIRTLTGANEEPLNPWAVQIAVDLKNFGLPNGLRM